MLQRWQHVAGLVLSIAAMAFAASFSGRLPVALVYVLAVALGVVLYRQGDRAATAGTVTGNVLVGYVGGIVLSLTLATGLLAWLLNVPVDFGLWQVALMMWDSWAGIGVAVLSGFFVAGFGALLN